MCVDVAWFLLPNLDFGPLSYFFCCHTFSVWFWGASSFFSLQMFAQKKVNLPSGRHKIIILDEADSMTSAAQQALRRLITN